MLVMSDTPVDICDIEWMDIEVRIRQFENITTTDTQAQFRMISAVVLKF